MTILFYRYGSICEPAIIRAFQKNSVTVLEETIEIADKKISNSHRVEIVHNAINKYHPMFVFSINFFPSIAEICHLHNIFYLCWTVDSPILELFASSVQHNTNRIFMFDRAQYEYFSPYNQENIFHLPLASDVEHYRSVLNTITSADRQLYSNDISFVGSLYNEKNPVHKLNLSPYAKGYINGLVDASLKIYGYNFMEEMINQELVNAIKDASTTFFHLDNPVANPDHYTIAHNYIGVQAAEVERINTLNKLAEYFQVDLYTLSDTSKLNNVNVHGNVKTLTEMPKVFNLSKINLNMTIKPIQTGLPLRIFDIMGCGGFLMTNYQAEIADHFTIGTDLEAYDSLEELVEKCAFYLANDEVREKIALNGYAKILKYHTYQHRITEMLRLIVK